MNNNNQSNSGSTPRSPKSPKSPKSKKREKIEKPPQDYEMIQQALLITLLTPHCEIVITKPLSKTKTMPSIYKIQKLKFDHEEMDFKTLIEQRTKDIIKDEIHNGIQEYKAKRHSEINRSSLAVNMLFDICLEFGYFFTLKKSRKTSSTIRIDRIEEIYYNGELYLNKYQVKDVSTQLYAILNQMFIRTATITIPKNCKELLDHLHLCIQNYQSDTYQHTQFQQIKMDEESEE